jgi:DNA polymerase V
MEHFMGLNKLIEFPGEFSEVQFLGNMVSIPVFSSPVWCGDFDDVPDPDQIDYHITLPGYAVPNPADTWGFRVNGRSMEPIIHPGELVLVDRSRRDNAVGKIVLAMVDGRFNVKRLKIINHKYFLVPENPAFKTIEINRFMEFIVWGVVVKILNIRDPE